mgnify:FL=1
MWRSFGVGIECYSKMILISVLIDNHFSYYHTDMEFKEMYCNIALTIVMQIPSKLIENIVSIHKIQKLPMS